MDKLEAQFFEHDQSNLNMQTLEQLMFEQELGVEQLFDFENPYYPTFFLDAIFRSVPTWENSEPIVISSDPVTRAPILQNPEIIVLSPDPITPASTQDGPEPIVLSPDSTPTFTPPTPPSPPITNETNFMFVFDKGLQCFYRDGNLRRDPHNEKHHVWKCNNRKAWCPIWNICSHCSDYLYCSNKYPLLSICQSNTNNFFLKKTTECIELASIALPRLEEEAGNVQQLCIK